MKLRSNRRLAGTSLANLIVVAALIPLFSVVFLGCYRRHGESANRVKCAANLKSMGTALLLYANDNRGEYPRTRYVAGAAVIPTWGTGSPTTRPFDQNGVAPNDVSAAIYLLMTTQEITGDTFICPNSNNDKWDFEGGSNTAANFSNWPGRIGVRKALSYSMQNPYPDDAAVDSGWKWSAGLNSEYAVAADINPGTSNAKENVLTVKASSNPQSMRAANSANHNQDGQQVLYGDGHVEFKTDPFSGIRRDNIYARRKPGSEKESSDVINSPLDANDSVLLPTDD